MKHFGSTVEFTEARNADLMRVYRSKIAQAKHIVVTDIFREVALSPSRRFWVSEERAAVVIAAMEAGKSIDYMTHNKRLMFEEIYRRYVLARQNDKTTALCRLVADIVNQPAPQFYLTVRSVAEFIYRMKNKWYDRRRKH